MTEDAVVRWHYQFDGDESEQTLKDSEGEGARHAAVPGAAKTEHDLVTEQQQQ